MATLNVFVLIIIHLTCIVTDIVTTPLMEDDGIGTSTTPQISSDNQSEDHTVDLIKKFEWLNDKQHIETKSLKEIKTIADEIIRDYEASQNPNGVLSYIALLKNLSQMIDVPLKQECRPMILKKSFLLVPDNFREYQNLYEFIRKFIFEHAKYCLSENSRQLSHAIMNKVMSTNFMTDDIKLFQGILNEKIMKKEGVNSSLRTLLSLPSNVHRKVSLETLIDYIRIKHQLSLEMETDESYDDHRKRFISEVDKFMNEAPDAFCKPIVEHLSMFEENFSSIIEIDPRIESEINTSDINWLNMLRTCDYIDKFGPIGLHYQYLSTRYTIKNLEQLLTDTNQEAKRMSPKETHKLLIILEYLYSERVLDVTRAIDVDGLLDAQKNHNRIWNGINLKALVDLHHTHSQYPNLDIYLKEQLANQSKYQLYQLNVANADAKSNLGLLERHKVTNWTHETKAMLDPSGNEKELWQLEGPMKHTVFQRGLEAYIKSKLKYPLSSENALKESFDKHLKETCKLVLREFGPVRELFEPIIQLGIIVRDEIHAWMSSHALCEYYLGRHVDWKEIFNHMVHDATPSR